MTDNAKLNWMYEGNKSTLNREEYLLGKKIDADFEKLEAEEKGSGPVYKVEHEILPGSVARRDLGQMQVDLARKIKEDPLFQIRKQEDQTVQELMDNPLKRRQLEKLRAAEAEAAEGKKKKKTKKKKAEKDIDQKLFAKMALLLQNGTGSGDSDTDSDSDDDRRKKKKKKKSSKHKSRLKEKKHKRARSPHGRSRSRSPQKTEKSKKKKKNRSRSSSSSSSSSSASSDGGKMSRKRDEARSQTEASSSKHRDRHSRETGNRHGIERTSGRSEKRPKTDDSGRVEKRRRVEEDVLHRPGDRSNSGGRHQTEYSKDGRRHHREGDDRRGDQPRAGEARERDTARSDRRSRDREDRHRHERRSRDRDDRPRPSRDRDDRPRPSRDSRQGEADRRGPDKTARDQRRRGGGGTQMTEEEMERKRQAMQDNARWRDQERAENVARYDSERRREEEELHDGAADGQASFVQKQLRAAAGRGTVEDRIKSNRYNIQRSAAAMDRSFVKR